MCMFAVGGRLVEKVKSVYIWTLLLEVWKNETAKSTEPFTFAKI